MQTRLTTSPQIAARFIRNGELAAFPTETVYGLGADAFNEKAIRKIFIAKGRPADNPLIVHISHISQVEQLAKSIPSSAERLIEEFFPGPLTLVLPKHHAVSPLITAGLQTVGIRMPNHPITKTFLQECGTPVVAPSANRSGKPSPTTWQAVAEDLDGRIACILKGKATTIGLESTVVDCTSRIPTILRTGATTLEQLRKIVPSMRIAHHLSMHNKAKSPGMKYRHYAPHATVRIIDSPDDASTKKFSAYIGLRTPSTHIQFTLVSTHRTIEEYAHALFSFFRQCDDAGIRIIYCDNVPEKGLGLALMDRIRRAGSR